jgi:hypothetical protein
MNTRTRAAKSGPLKGRRVAILATDGFEQSELLMMLIEPDVLRDRRLTSWPSLQTDVRNAGGRWVDGEVVVDRGLVTSRKPEDIPAFNKRMIEAIAEGAPSARMDRSTAEI